jgi:hypothetical protein
MLHCQRQPPQYQPNLSHHRVHLDHPSILHPHWSGSQTVSHHRGHLGHPSILHLP